MKIIKVIHGYPMRYNAGSEVYSQMLCQYLAKEHDVHVFTRKEDVFLPDYSQSAECDPDDLNVKLHVVNLPSDRHRYRYRHAEIDAQFARLIEEVNPDIVHIGHLNHLSTSLVKEAYDRQVPIVFTLHDYWLMCPRGQFMQTSGTSNNELYPVCDGQSDRKCATQCYSGCASGAEQEQEVDINYWQNWVKRRMHHIREMAEMVDHFIAPSRYLYRRFIDDFGLPEEKISYIDYGFDTHRFFKKRERLMQEPFTFGYIGTHIPAKGIQDLIQAFGLMKQNAILRIWGRPSAHTVSLKRVVLQLSLEKQSAIEWMHEYKNSEIVSEVFNQVDCIVVPSIWVENSPLVIHEALQARLPVITANTGGMSEYVQHERNGLLFEHRSVESLAEQMERLAANPDLAIKLGKVGYLLSENGDIPDMQNHVEQVSQLYANISQRNKR